jgi:murein DD-endopeptidase MepM/ murein hydrolase activator NlpD
MRADPFDQPFRGGPPAARQAAKPRGGPPPQPSPLTNPANAPTAMGLKMGLATPGSAAYRGFTTRGRTMMTMHQGIDLAADLGTPIRAAGDGVVKGAELKGGYGNWIEIEHDDLVDGAKRTKLATVYGHLSAFADGIAPGTRVRQGEVIGYVGSTGRSTGPHLHFEILHNGHPTNPMASPALKPPQLKGGELARFKKAIARDLSERQKEAGSI